MANLPQSSQSTSMDSLTVTREQFRLGKKDELEFLAQALGNVSGSYTTETVSPTAVTLQGTPTLATGAEPAADDSSLRLANTRWVKKYANSASATAPVTPSDGQIWVDISQDPPLIMVWDDTNSQWIQAGGGGGASVTIADVAPTGAAAGDLWWDSVNGQLYVWYEDANSNQWVQANTAAAAFWTRTGTTLSPATAGDDITTTGRLLVGTASSTSQAKAVVQGTASANGPGRMDIAFGSSTPATTEDIGILGFTNNAGNLAALVAGVRDGGTWTPGASHPGRVVFSTTPDGSATPVERMRVTKDGIVQIGQPPATTYPAGIGFHVHQGSATGGEIRISNDNTATTNGLRLYYSGSNDAVIANEGNSAIVFIDNGVERLRISQDGTIRHNASRVGGSVNGFQSDSTTGGTFAFLAGLNGADQVRIQHDGNCLKPGGGSWNAISDERAKEEISDYTAGLTEIKQLEPRSYKYIGQDQNTYYGLVAQECEGVMPEMVTKGDGELPDGTEVDDYRTLNTTPLTFALLNAVKELSAQNAALEARLTALEGN